MGRDKARVKLNEQTTLIEAATAPLRSRFGGVVAVADRPGKYDDLGFETIADDQPHRGPLGGILTACAHSDHPYLFVLGCDRLGLNPDWVDILEKKLEGTPPAVAFVHDGRWQPLFAFYRTDLTEDIQQFLDGESAAVWRFLEQIGAVGVDAPAEWSDTLRVNTPEQLAIARSM